MVVFSAEEASWRAAGRPSEMIVLVTAILVAGVLAAVAAAILGVVVRPLPAATLAISPAAWLAVGHALDPRFSGAEGFLLALPVAAAMAGTLAWVGGRRAGAAGLAAVLALGGAWVYASTPGRPQPQARAVHPNAPDVILLVMDTTRRDHLTLYGYPRPTSPRLEALGAESEVYEDAWSVAPWTPSSHASILTGLLPAQHGVDGEDPVPFNPDVLTLQAVFESAGYRTAGFVSNPNLLPAGWNRHFGDYRPPWHRGPHSLVWWLNKWQLGSDNAWGRAMGRLTTRNLEIARSWWDANQGRPRFLFINLLDPHRPYDPPRESYRRFLPDVDPHEAFAIDQDPDTYALKPGLTPRKADILGRLYDAEIASMDAEIGRFVDWLRARNDLDKTVLVITADHGERLGERGLVGHEAMGVRGMDEYLLRVPLLIRYPKGAPATRVMRRVQLDGLAGHLLRLAGIEVPPAIEARPWTRPDAEIVVAQFQSADWIAERLVKRDPGFDPKPDLSDRFLASDGRYAYSCVGGGGDCFLDDMESDPDWSRDASSGHADVVAKLATAIRALPSFRPVARIQADQEILDRLRSLGYVR